MIEIVLSGVVGQDITARGLRAELKNAGGDPVILSINSPGGSVFEGKECLDLIRNYSGEVVARITGLAASMASVIACAADRLIVNSQSVLMIHRSAGGAYGDTNEMESMRSILENIDNQIAEVYSMKSGIPTDRVLELMDSETWLYGEEITAQGFADEFEHEEGQHDRAAAILDARQRFAAAYRAPSAAEVAAYGGGAVSTVKSFSAWEAEHPRNDKVKAIIAKARREGRTPEHCLTALLMATGGGLTDEDQEAARLVGMSPAEYSEAMQFLEKQR